MSSFRVGSTTLDNGDPALMAKVEIVKVRAFWSPSRLALAMFLLAGSAVLLTLGDPGITTDEPLDVRPGRTYVETLRVRGLGFFERATVDRVFRDNAEHPPLGRWLLGLASTLGQPFEIQLFGADPIGLYLRSGRLAPAFCFALLVGLITHTAARRHEIPAGAAAGFALLVMPRCFAHAHFGALDTFITLFWTGALLGSERALTSKQPILAMFGAGALWSLALLTKIHAWFLIPVVFIWCFVRLNGKLRAFAAFSVWLVTGLTLFVLGWPWLWFDSATRLRAYLGTGVERASIRVLYFGEIFADKDVPWHYPWIYFALTVPVGLHILGAGGVVRAWRNRRDDPFSLLLLGSILMFLSLFSTRIPVYDGERLFLMVFPLWSILIGREFRVLWTMCSGKTIVRVGLLIFMLVQGYGVVTYHPFGLSYYNAFVGGLSGAESRGLELTFWGDAVDRVLLDEVSKEVPGDAAIVLVPTLYPGQGIASTTPAMARKPVLLSDQENLSRARWVVVSRRSAYWPVDLQERLQNGRLVYQRVCRGVWLSALYALDPSKAPPIRSSKSSSWNVQSPPSQSSDD